MFLNVSVPYSKHWQTSASFMVEYISGALSLTSLQHLSPCSVHFSYPLLAGYVCQQFNAIKSSSLWCIDSLWIHKVFKQNSPFCHPKYLLEYLSCFHQSIWTGWCVQGEQSNGAKTIKRCSEWITGSSLVWTVIDNIN